jgi:hypothetical protein
MSLFNQGSLTEGKARYGYPPCANYPRSAPFYIDNNSYPFSKDAVLIRSSIVLSLPVQLVFPG